MSCVREIEPTTESDLHEVVFHAGWDAETKTALQEDGSVWWSPGDEISLFIGDGRNYRLTSTNTESAAEVDFVGQAGDGSADYVAVFPYGYNDSYDGTYVRVDIPNFQRAPKGSFDRRAFVSIAKSSNEQLSFKNLCGGIKFSVASEGIKEIHFAASWGMMHSLLKVNPDDLTDMEWVGNSSGDFEVRPEGDYFEVGEYYYAILPVGLYPHGLTVRYIKDDSYAIYHAPATEIKKSVFKRLYDKEADLKFKRIYDNKGVITESCVLPAGVDKSSITEVHFNVNSDVETSTTLPHSSEYAPIFFDLRGTVANYYTSADVIELRSGSLFRDWTHLRSVDLSAFDVQIDDLSYMFSGCAQLKDITWGDFSTEDVVNMAGMFEGCASMTSLDVSTFNTSNVTDFGGMFSGCRSLEAIDLRSFDLSNAEKTSYMFDRCSLIKTIEFPHSSTSNLQMMHYMFSGCYALEHVDLSSFDTSNVDMMIDLFKGCRCLRSLDLSNFNTEKVASFRSLFSECINLEHLNISSFKSTVLVDAETMLYGTRKLTTLDLGELDLHDRVDGGTGLGLGELSKDCHIRCTEQTKSALIEASSRLGNESLRLSNEKYKWHTDGSLLPDVSFEFEENLYCSTDYSKDKAVRTVQLATEGAGIDIVLMGDAYSDRLIADGTYDKDMERAIDAIFTVEPFKSFKHLFNIYIVYAVSENEVIGKSTALDCRDTPRPIGSASFSWYSYYFSAAKNYYPGNISPIILMHSDSDLLSDGAATGFIAYHQGGGDYYMNDPRRDDYSGGFSEAQAYILGQTARFDYAVRHEFGHSFGFLMDEYIYTDMGGISYFDWEFCFAYGLWKNVDIVSGSSVKWAKFINDPRYAGTGIGVYEGAYLPTDMWRPSPTSIMRDDEGDKCGFNAPSREAIYYRIHKLAFGKTWQYDYDTFVQWDAPNIAADKEYHSTHPTQLKSTAVRPAKKPCLEMRDVVLPDGREGKRIIMY